MSTFTTSTKEPEVENGRWKVDEGSISSDHVVSSNGASGGVKRHRSVSLNQKPDSQHHHLIKAPKIHKRKPKTYRSVISDIFDGKLESMVQCLTCHRVSTTTETFQVGGYYLQSFVVSSQPELCSSHDCCECIFTDNSQIFQERKDNIIILDSPV